MQFRNNSRDCWITNYQCPKVFFACSIFTKKKLVEKHPKIRISSVSDLKQKKIFTDFDWTLQAIKSNDYVKTFIEKYGSDPDYKFLKTLDKPFSNFSASHNFVANSAKKGDPEAEIDANIHHVEGFNYVNNS